MTSVFIEVCVDSVQSLRAAVAGNADRIELCSALEVGGLTPAGSLMRAAATTGVPVYAMIRPRAGDFIYSQDEVDLMVDDIHACRRIGLAGIVTGAAHRRELDETAMGKLAAAAAGLGITLHRVFDTLADPYGAIDVAAALGIERILTSGGALTAETGATQIRKYVEYAGDRISIMAGGGIGPDNAVRIVRLSGTREIHGSFSSVSRPFDPLLGRFGFAEDDGLKVSDGEKLRIVRKVLSKF